MRLPDYLCTGWLALIFMVFGSPSRSLAETANVQPHHIVIVADHSGSMHTEFGFIDMQTTAIVETLASYTADCGTTRISYVPWGSEPAAATTIDLNDDVARYHLADQILSGAHTNRGGTNHAAAYWYAKGLITPHETGVMIFLTDDFGEKTVTDAPRFVLHKISLHAAEGYLTKGFVGGYGTVHQASTTAVLTQVLTTILTSTKVAFCLG